MSEKKKDEQYRRKEQSLAEGSCDHQHALFLQAQSSTFIYSKESELSAAKLPSVSWPFRGSTPLWRKGVSSQQKPRGLAAQSNRGRETHLLTRHVVLRNQFCSIVEGHCFWGMDEDDETIVLLENQEILPLQWCVVLSCLLFDIAEAVSKDLDYSDRKRRSWVRTYSGAALSHSTGIQTA
jgi:hypothetical protein